MPFFIIYVCKNVRVCMHVKIQFLRKNLSLCQNVSTGPSEKGAWDCMYCMDADKASLIRAPTGRSAIVLYKDVCMYACHVYVCTSTHKYPTRESLIRIPIS